MPSHATSTASLRISGRELVPDEITRLLGCRPTRCWARGDTVPRPELRAAYVPDFGHWALEAPERDPEDIEGQITELLSMVNPSDEVWRSLGERYSIEIFTGYFMSTENHELLISANTLMTLGLRRIRLHFDIYERALEDL